jgi:hypothetical protein
MNNTYGAFAPVFATGTLYLSFLHFASNDLPEAMHAVREACSGPTALADLKQFAEEQGWREHLILCAAMLADKSIVQDLTLHLWRAFDRGSWVSPQLAVTAWLRDGQFNAEARRRIESLCRVDTRAIQQMPPMERHVVAGPGTDEERSAKGFAALGYLSRLSIESSSWLPRVLGRPEMAALLQKDCDCGDKIAEKWLSSVRSRAALLGIDLT